MKPEEHALAVEIAKVEITFEIKLRKDLSGFLQRDPTMGKLPNKGQFEWLRELIHPILRDFKSRLPMVKRGRD